jgi:hypothetical protein
MIGEPINSRVNTEAAIPRPDLLAIPVQLIVPDPDFALRPRLSLPTTSPRTTPPSASSIESNNDSQTSVLDGRRIG